MRKKIIEEIINDPQQVLELEDDIIIYQSVIKFGSKKKYLVRVVVSDIKE